MDIANRTKERAVNLISECPYDNDSTALTIAEAEQRIAEYDLIIQTTSIGMSPNVDDSPLDVANIRVHAFVSDIIYNPLKTKILMRSGEKRSKNAKWCRDVCISRGTCFQHMDRNSCLIHQE